MTLLNPYRTRPYNHSTRVSQASQGSSPVTAPAGDPESAPPEDSSRPPPAGRPGVWVLDVNARTTYANPELSALLGLPPADLAGRHIDTILDPPEPGWLDAHRPAPRSYTVVLPTTPPRPASLSVAFRQDPTGVQSTVIVVTPLTKATTAPSAPLRNSLVGQISHELATPILAVSGYTTLLAAALGAQPIAGPTTHDQPAPALSPEVGELLNGLQNASEHLTALVASLSDLAQVSEMASVHGEAVSVANLFTAVRSLVRTQAGERRVTIDLDADTIVVTGDRALLIRALVNLVTNAIKYGPTDAVVQLRACQLTSSTQRPPVVRMTVTDEGPGLGRFAAHHRFRPFTRGPGAHRVDGLGLGLSVVKAIAEAHCGAVGVNEHGAVYLELPC